MLQFLILSLVTWRICILIQQDTLPFRLGDKFRYLIGYRYDEHSQLVPTTELSRMVSCIYCLSIWITLPISVLYYGEQFLIYWLALSASAIGWDKWIN